MRTDLYQGHDYYLLDDLLTEEHKLIRETAREWVKKEVSPIIEEAAEKCEFPRHLLPGLGEIGAFGPYIPAEYGGPGLDQVSYGILMQELERCDSGLRSTASVQSSLVMYPIWRYGSEEQKQKYLPKLATGEMMGCFGLTEPDHGSNPGGMTTNFKEDGDHVILNGAKMWTTMAHIADYVILLTRTDPDVPKHKGLTFFLVPFDTPGIEIQPVPTMATERSNATFYDDVRLSDDWRVGEVNGGWAVMKTALKYERGIAGGQFMSPPVIDAGIDWATNHERADGTRPIDDPAVRERLIRAQIDVEVCRGFAYHCADLANEGAMFGVEGSMTKLFASETFKRHCREIHDMMGAEGLVTLESPEAHRGGLIEEALRHSPVTAIYGGTSEINRNMVAEGFLGLPRAR